MSRRKQILLREKEHGYESGLKLKGFISLYKNMIEQKLRFTLSLLCVCGGVLIIFKSRGHDFPTHKSGFLYFYGFIES